MRMSEMRWPRFWTGLSIALSLALTGCVTSKKYKMAKDDAQPAVPLNLTSAAADFEATLQTVIVYKGPGSWKREARWDEYVLQLTNHGKEVLNLETVALIDLLDQPQVPGEDPWKLEKLSKSNWDKYGRTGLKLLAGAGAVTLYTAAASATLYGAAMGGGVSVGAVVALNIIPVVAIVDIAAVAVMNHNNKKKVQEEFDRRRLRLPLRLAPGATLAGSCFFPMTPSPRRIILSGRMGTEPVEVTIDLRALSGLHLKPGTK